MKWRLFFITFSLLFVAYTAIAQTYYSQKALIEDLDTLYATINAVHPDMFTVVSQQEFKKNLQTTKKSLPDSLDVIGFFAYVAPLVSSIGDGHTSLGFPTEAMETLNPSVFPFVVAIEKGDTAIMVKADLTGNNKIPEGSRIVSINGRSDKEILKYMANFACAESYWFKMIKVYYLFHCYMYLLDPADIFEIEYLWQNKPFRLCVPAVPYKLTEERRHERIPQYAGPSYSLVIDEKNNFVMFGFDEFEYDEGKFKQYVDSTFTILEDKKIGNLIIDLRENGGGESDVGDMILQYIASTPFSQYGSVKIKISAPLKRRFKWLAEDEIGVRIETVPLIPLEENPLRYLGQVYLLTSSKTFSAATDFAWAFRYFNMGTIIGEETGGFIVSFGDTASFKLPNTNMSYGSSWKDFYGYGATDANRHGVVPDIAVPADEALNKALEVINLNKRQ